MVLTIDEFEQKYPTYRNLDYLKTFFTDEPINECITFPLKNTEVFIINCNDYWNSPFRTDDDQTWVVVKISDWSKDLSCKSEQELIAKVYSYEKYSKYNYNNEYTKDIDFTVYSNEGKPCSRGSLTYEEYKHILSIEHSMHKFMRENDLNKKMKWRIDECLKSTPHIEKPFKLYVVGVDDSSYTMVYETKDQLYSIVNNWKSNGIVDDENWNCMFTN